MKNIKIGSYTFQKGTYFSKLNLEEYIWDCIRNMLDYEKWWKQPKTNKEFTITITYKQDNAYKTQNEN